MANMLGDLPKLTDLDLKDILGVGFTVPTEGELPPVRRLRCLAGRNSSGLPRNISRHGSSLMGSRHHRHQPVVPMTSCLVKATR
jgi:hypothetical protein